MFHLRNDTFTLQASRDQTHSHTAEIVIRTEPFPIAATASSTPERTSDRKQGNVDTFAVILFSERFAISEHQFFVKGGSNGQLSWKRGDKFLPANTGWSIGEAERADPESRNGRCVANAGSYMAAGEVDFLLEGESID